MHADVLIIGGGAIGLAIFAEASRLGLVAVLLERHDSFGRETSSRNSGVIHGGMYYAPGSLKAKLCVDGRRLLYDYAESRKIPYSRCGKVIVAVDAAEKKGLEAILSSGIKNGVEGLRPLLAQDELDAMAPGVTGVMGLYSPETGVIDVHALMDALAADAEALGGMGVCGAEVVGLGMEQDGWEINYRDSEGLGSIHASTVVNAAGLGAQKIMRLAGMNPNAADLTLYPCKGRYYAVHGESRKRIKGLIYPAPEQNLAGLGIHTLVDIGGGVKLGPDVEYIPESEEYDYGVDDSRRNAFFKSAKRYLPYLEEKDISPDMSGVRPKLSGPGQPVRDFYIADESRRGLPGFINLAGIESPGLTACLAIGNMVAGMISENNSHTVRGMEL